MPIRHPSSLLPAPTSAPSRITESEIEDSSPTVAKEPTELPVTEPKFFEPSPNHELPLAVPLENLPSEMQTLVASTKE
jgi:hypothetical protein